MASILVIDDEDSLRAALRRNLQKAGYHVIEANEGRQGLQQLASFPVNLVLIDIFMPGKEGLETIRELRRSYPNIPVIAMSGGGSKGMADVLGVATLLGARRTLLKPFTGQELLEAVQHELAKV
ncbi:MAG TPA: response regulator [Nitrospira sp.]|jgi:two-component system, chemotaxis family, chemotaxis protein CheY|nr:response regulator [Nitrospira sp.]